MLQDIKDEILDTSSQLDNNPRYVIRDNNGNVVTDNAQIELKTPRIQEGTPLNKELFDTLQTKMIGYNVLSDYEDAPQYYAPNIIAQGGFSTFTTDTIGYVSVAQFKNGNIFVGYSVGAGAKFSIIKPDGTVVKTVNVGNYTTTYTAAKTLPSGNVVMAWSDSSGAYAWMINENGGMQGDKITINSGNTSDNARFISLDVLKNGNVVVAFADTANSAYPSFVMLGLNEQNNLYLLKSKTVIYSATSAGVTVSAMKNGNIFFGYQGGSGYKGTSFSIYDGNGNSVIARADLRAGSTSTTSNSHLVSSVFDNGDILVAYGHTHKTDTDYGSCSIVTGDTYVVKKHTDFYTSHRPVAIDVVHTENDEMVIMFNMGQGNAGNQYVVIDVSGKEVLQETRFDSVTTIAPYGLGATIIDGNVYAVYEGQVRTVLRGTAYLNRNYLIPNLNEPAMGQTLKTWRLSNEKINEMLKSNNNSSLRWRYTNMKILSNGNIVLAHVGNNSGIIEVYSSSGELINSRVFAGSYVYEIYLDAWDDGTFIIAWRNNNTKLIFQLVNSDGSLINTVTWTTKTVDIEGCLVLPNNNVFILVNQATNGTSFLIYGKDGNVVKDYTNFGNVMSSGTATMSLMKNGNIFVAWGTGYYAILSQNGDIVKQATQFHTNANTPKDSVVLDDSNIMVFYTNGLQRNALEFIIFDQDGNIVKNSTIIVGKYCSGMRAKKMSDGNIIIVFTATDSEYQGQFLIINQNGEAVKDVAIFEMDSVADARHGIDQSSDGNIVLFYSRNHEQTSSDTYYQSFLKSIINIYDYERTDIVSNSIDGISADTLFEYNKFHELVYDGEKYLAKEARV